MLETLPLVCLAFLLSLTLCAAQRQQQHAAARCDCLKCGSCRHLGGLEMNFTPALCATPKEKRIS